MNTSNGGNSGNRNGKVAGNNESASDTGRAGNERGQEEEQEGPEEEEIGEEEEEEEAGARRTRTSKEDDKQTTWADRDDRGAREQFHSALDLSGAPVFSAANDAFPLRAADDEGAQRLANFSANLRLAQARHEKPLKRTRLAGQVIGKQPARANKKSKPAACQGKQALVLALFLIGLVVCVGSLACLLLLPGFVGNQIARKLVLRNNSLLLERWSRPNVPMQFKVWLFNVKNAQELAERRDTEPKVEEIGPFVFNLRRQKDVVSFAADNLYYTERRFYHFNRELSCCAINTTVTIPNIPLVAVVDRALGYNLPIVGRFIPRLINRAIQSLREQLFVRKQVREILFDGYDVELLRMVSRIGSLVGMPQQSQNFALLKGRNGTWRPEQDGVWAINTGERDRKQFGRVASWNSYKRLPFWPAAQCNVINGSDGTLFPPPIKRSEPLYIFNQELCRTVNLVYDRPSDVRSIRAYRFVLNPMNFAHTVEPAPLSGATSGPVRVKPAFQNPRLLSTPAESNLAQAEPGMRIAASPGSHSVNAPPITAARQGLRSAGSRLSIRAAAAANTPTSSSSSSSTATATSTTSAPVSRFQNAEKEAEAEEAEVLSQQAKLIREAQKTQLASERRAGSQLNPQTCFCDRKTTNLNGVNVCEFDGLIDLSKCSKQAQVIFGSMPHFHNSDPRLLRQVSGLEPNASRHTTYLDIEPNTGLVLGGKRRVQLNVIIKHNNEIDGFENIQDMLVPIVWFEESAMIPEESAQKFRSLYIERVRLVNWTLVSLFVGSLILLVVDARLLLAGHQWRQFKLMPSLTQTGQLAPQVRSARPLANQTINGRLRAKRAPHKPLGKLATLSRGSEWAAAAKAEGRVRDSSAAPLAKTAPKSRANSQLLGSNLPLLKHNSSSSASSNSCTSTSNRADSSSSSGGETPPNSPELRKWSAHQSKPGTSETKRALEVTRIQLTAARSATPNAPGPPPEVDDGATRAAGLR